jgi:single-stranded DNA-binding protein
LVKVWVKALGWVSAAVVAVSNGKNAQGEDLAPTWIKVSVWRKYAETVARFVKKGDRGAMVERVNKG